MRREHRNVSGQVYGLTVLIPVADGREQELTEHLDSLSTGDESPLAQVPGTHFARWVVIPDVVYEGHGQRQDHLAAPRLLFTSNFDGSLDEYLERLAPHTDAIWRYCRGYPGSDGFAAWMRAHQVRSSLFFAAYGEQTVSEVHANLELRARLIDFALNAQGLAPAELQARFRERFPL
jgi:hypothetical protein